VLPANWRWKRHVSPKRRLTCRRLKRHYAPENINFQVLKYLHLFLDAWKFNLLILSLKLSDVNWICGRHIFGSTRTHLYGVIKIEKLLFLHKCNFLNVFWMCLWSSDQSSWLQIQKSGFDSPGYQIFWEVVVLERDPLSLVIATGELLWRKRSCSCLKNRIRPRGPGSISTATSCQYLAVNCEPIV
jgi:hypothetical protein